MKNQKIQYTSWEYEAQKKQGPCFNFYLLVLIPKTL